MSVGKGTKNRYSGYTGGASDWLPDPRIEAVARWCSWLIGVDPDFQLPDGPAWKKFTKQAEEVIQLCW